MTTELSLHREHCCTAAHQSSSPPKLSMRKVANTAHDLSRHGPWVMTYDLWVKAREANHKLITALPCLPMPSLHISKAPTPMKQSEDNKPQCIERMGVSIVPSTASKFQTTPQDTILRCSFHANLGPFLPMYAAKRHTKFEGQRPTTAITATGSAQGDARIEQERQEHHQKQNWKYISPIQDLFSGSVLMFLAALSRITKFPLEKLLSSLWMTSVSS